MHVNARSDKQDYVNTPPSERERRKLSNSSRNRKTKNFTMARKKRERKRFSKNVGWHISSRYPSSSKRAGLNMFANKVMSNIDMF